MAFKEKEAKIDMTRLDAYVQAALTGLLSNPEYNTHRTTDAVTKSIELANAVIAALPKE